MAWDEKICLVYCFFRCCRLPQHGGSGGVEGGIFGVLLSSKSNVLISSNKNILTIARKPQRPLY